PTLLDNDDYTVRVTAQDVNGRQTIQQFTLGLTAQAKLGNFRQEFTDLTVPLAGVPITITRVYDSLKADQSGDFGFGWSLKGYDARVRETLPVSPTEAYNPFAAVPFKQGTRIYLDTPDGRRVGFTFDPVAEAGLLSVIWHPRFKAD